MAQETGWGPSQAAHGSQTLMARKGPRTALPQRPELWEAWEMGKVTQGQEGTAASQPPNLGTEQKRGGQSTWPVEGVEGSAGHPWVSVQERRDRLWFQRNF